MISGAITKNPSFCINSISNNTHHPKPTLLFQNRVFSSKSHRFRTKATINDEFVISKTLSNMSFYELLGISESDSVYEIKQAYKQLARKYHPDVSPPDRAEEYTKRFILVKEAYETLSDPSRRVLYDRDMARGLHLAFSARRGCDEGLMEREEWRNRWQGQVEELRNKRMNMSWAAQMRQKRFESDATD